MGVPRPLAPHSRRDRRRLSSREHPVRDVPPALPQLPIEPAKVRLMARDQRPEALRVIHVHAMTKLVHQQIADDLGTLEQEAGIETQYAAARTAPPACALAANFDSNVVETDLVGHLGEPGFEHLASAVSQPGLQHAHPAAFIVTARGDRDLAIAADLEARALALLMEHRPGLRGGRKLDRRRYPVAAWRHERAHFVDLARDPVAVPDDETLHDLDADAARDDDLHAAPGVDTH